MQVKQMDYFTYSFQNRYLQMFEYSLWYFVRQKRENENNLKFLFHNLLLLYANFFAHQKKTPIIRVPALY